MLLLDLQVKQRNIYVLGPFAADESRMDGRCYRIGIVRIHTRTPKGSACTDLRPVGGVEPGTWNSYGKSAIFFAVEARDRHGGRCVTKVRALGRGC